MRHNSLPPVWCEVDEEKRSGPISGSHGQFVIGINHAFVTKAKAHGWESTNPGYPVQRWHRQRHHTPHRVPKSSPEDASIRALDWLP